MRFTISSSIISSASALHPTRLMFMACRAFDGVYSREQIEKMAQVIYEEILLPAVQTLLHTGRSEGRICQPLASRRLAYAPPTRMPPHGSISDERINENEEVQKLYRRSALPCRRILHCGLFGIKKKSALNISGAQIDYETFLYYFDQVHAFPEKYELAADATNEQMIDAAIELCCEYVAVNTKLSEYGLTLSASEKRSASNNLEDLWHVFFGLL